MEKNYNGWNNSNSRSSGPGKAKGEEKKMILWSVKRTIIEEFEVLAETKEDASKNVLNPHNIEVIKEVIKKVK